jgi:hypothetical protein
MERYSGEMPTFRAKSQLFQAKSRLFGPKTGSLPEKVPFQRSYFLLTFGLFKVI